MKLFSIGDIYELPNGILTKVRDIENYVGELNILVPLNELSRKFGLKNAPFEIIGVFVVSKKGYLIRE